MTLLHKKQKYVQYKKNIIVHA